LRLADFGLLKFAVTNNRPALLTPAAHHAKLTRMYMSKMTRQEIAELLHLVAEWEREELALLMRERMEAEREGRLH
jgi:hypothetical protein